MKRRANGSTSFMTVKSKSTYYFLYVSMLYLSIEVWLDTLGRPVQCEDMYLKVKPHVVFALSSGTTENDDSVNDERTMMRPSSP